MVLDPCIKRTFYNVCLTHVLRTLHILLCNTSRPGPSLIYPKTSVAVDDLEKDIAGACKYIFDYEVLLCYDSSRLMEEEQWWCSG